MSSDYTVQVSGIPSGTTDSQITSAFAEKLGMLKVDSIAWSANRATATVSLSASSNLSNPQRNMIAATLNVSSFTWAYLNG